MFRCLPRYSITWWFGLSAVLVVVMTPAISQAQIQTQDRTTENRLDRIERDLNMLERQVYRGAPAGMSAPPAGGGASGGATSAADVEIRMERVEAQMRDLTGQVQEIANGLDQLKQRVEQINSDIDVRFSQFGGVATGPAASPAPPTKIAAGPAPSAGMAPGTVVPGPSDNGLNPIFNTLSPPGMGPPRQSAPPPETGGTEGPLVGGSPGEQFNHAFGLMKQADYPGAEVALKAFVAAHPNDPLAGNAQYWLGQTYFARNRFPEAATAFAEGYKRFPKGQKAAEDLLYMGMSLAKADQKKNACLALAQLSEAFPHPAAAVRERADAEKKRIGCS
jgi:tol-pal system protein YbgF